MTFLLQQPLPTEASFVMLRPWLAPKLNICYSYFGIELLDIVSLKWFQWFMNYHEWSSWSELSKCKVCGSVVVWRCREAMLSEVNAMEQNTKILTDLPLGKVSIGWKLV